MTETENGETAVNDTRTSVASDTNVTQECSGFDLENARRDLIAKRVAAGANSEIGHRCSNLIEQLEHYRTAEGEQREHLAKSIQRSLAELAARSN